MQPKIKAAGADTPTASIKSPATVLAATRTTTAYKEPMVTKHEVIDHTPLVYGGVPIREKGEMLSLTDMWKAAGSDNSRTPAEWLRSADAQRFIQFLGVAQNMADSHVIEKRQGRNGGTHAHWQVGLAYAKYLSPEFHMWCNQVVRQRMEGHNPQMPADVVEQIERTNGIVRMLASKVTGIENALPAMTAMMTEAAVQQHLANSNLLTRRGVTAKQVWDRHHLTPGLKGSTKWIGNRLAEMGAEAAKADRGNGSIRLFDPDLAEVCMKNGLRHKAKVYASERMGQTRLNLVQGGQCGLPLSGGPVSVLVHDGSRRQGRCLGRG